MNKFTTALLAAAVLVASASAAMAAPGVATGNANVRAGAGTGYAVISSVQYGQPVDIQYCSGNWCFVEKSGRDGWVSANYLEVYRGHDRPRHRRIYDDYDYGYGYGHGRRSIGISTCFGGGSANVCVGF